MLRAKFIQIAINYGIIISIALPSVFQFAHIFEEHEHIPCEISDQHFHEHSLDCHFNEFLTPTASYSFIWAGIDQVSQTFERKEQIYNAPSGQSISQSIFLRGPPSFRH
jgi:hypothetical protein